MRPGLRSAFSRARRPVVLNRRSIGQPITDASGRTMYLAESATPTNIRIAPNAIAPSLAEAGPEPNRPWAASRPPTRIETTVSTAAMRRARFEGRGATPDIAVTGSARVARTAGTSDEITVTPIPTPSAIAIVRGASTRSERGMPKPAASKSELRSFEKPMPTAIPSTEARTPISRASPVTAARICLLVVPGPGAGRTPSSAARP